MAASRGFVAEVDRSLAMDGLDVTQIDRLRSSTGWTASVPGMLAERHGPFSCDLDRSASRPG